ncbi:hypothetical protein MBLNU230_g7982t1 [Neophaeotheca triangularis]
MTLTIEERQTLHMHPDHDDAIHTHPRPKPDYGLTPGSILLICLLGSAVLFIALTLYLTIDIGLWPRWYRRRMRLHEARGAQARHHARLRQTAVSAAPATPKSRAVGMLWRNDSHAEAHKVAAAMGGGDGLGYAVRVAGGRGSVYGRDLSGGDVGGSGGVYAGPGTGRTGEAIAMERVDVLLPEPVRVARK